MSAPPGDAAAADPAGGPVRRGFWAALVPVVAALAALCAFFPVTDTDIWWHLSSGRLMVERGELLWADPFSASTWQRPWTNLHWLFQLGVYGLHTLGGLRLLVVGKSVLVGLAAWAAVAAADGGRSRRRRALAVACMAAAPLAAQHLLLARPVVVSLLLLSVDLLLLERFVQRQRALWLLPIPLLQVLWSNTQPLFLLGPALVGCYLVGAATERLASRAGVRGIGRGLPPTAVRSLLGVAVVTLLACLATPYGLAGLALPLKLFGRIDPEAGNLFAHNVSENIPPWLLERHGAPAVVGFTWLSASVFASFLLAWGRISVSRLLVVAAFWLTALMANRNVLLFYWVAPLAVAPNLEVAMAAARRRWRWRWPGTLGRSPVVAGLAASLLLVTAVRTWQHNGPTSEPAPFRIPVQAAARLRGLPPRGLFCSVRYGGYLIWALHPAWRPYIDGRLVLRDSEQVAAYLQALDDPETFAALAARHDLRAAALPVAYPDRYRPLIRHLHRHPDWHLVYTDGTETLFLKGAEHAGDALDLASPEVVGKQAEALERRYAGLGPAATEQALMDLGSLLMLLGYLDGATEVLERLDSHDGRVLLAQSHLLAGQLRLCREILTPLLRDRGPDPNVLVLLAHLALAEGAPLQALRNAAQAVRHHPFHPQARQTLRVLQR